jgi:hypothetical protein
MMLAEPGWVIPAGRHERRYAALEVSEARLGDTAYFKALHRQINEGGAEAMFYDLQRVGLGDWHPRDIPESLLHSAALQRQQGYSLSPLEQWYLGLLHDGRLPGATAKHPNRALTKDLREHVGDRVPRLKWDVTEVALANFLDKEKGNGVGNVCDKARTSAHNGWSFPPLAECREVFEKFFGPQRWGPPVEWAAPIPVLDQILGEELKVLPAPAPAPKAAPQALTLADLGFTPKPAPGRSVLNIRRRV